MVVANGQFAMLQPGLVETDGDSLSGAKVGTVRACLCTQPPLLRTSEMSGAESPVGPV